MYNNELYCAEVYHDGTTPFRIFGWNNVCCMLLCLAEITVEVVLPI